MTVYVVFRTRSLESKHKIEKILIGIFDTSKKALNFVDRKNEFYGKDTKDCFLRYSFEVWEVE